MNKISPDGDGQSRWRLSAFETGIVWDVAGEDRLPHADHLEMSGRRLSVIVRYSVDTRRRLTVSREVIWPALRVREGDVRGFLRREYGDEVLPTFAVDGRSVSLGPVQKITIAGGAIRFLFEPVAGLGVTRTLFPSRTKGCLLENWTLTNGGNAPLTVIATLPGSRERTTGVYGDYLLEQRMAGSAQGTIDAGKQHVFPVVFAASRASDTEMSLQGEAEEEARAEFAGRMASASEHLCLTTPDPIFNTAFAFAKLRAAESLFDTQMGLVHSPGGGRYYGGVWANDQAEYSGPFFAFLNDERTDEAALTAYRNFAGYTNPAYDALPTSLEAEGTILIHAGGDRGDAAMIAGGASRYALTRGDRAIAEELWPLVQWCLEFCRRQTNTSGVVESDTDELEGRFPTGTANLSTSCLAYDGLRRGADLAHALGKTEEGHAYARRADALSLAIERYFGATVEGFSTYRYYDGNATLRSWICLPLVFDLAHREKRKQGTIAALFSPRLWTPDGLATEAGDTVFWDRSTLYALRGVFRAGATETAFAFLKGYTHRRLLGEHVPYPVEAHPEGGQAHLSAESALYCRIFLEGLLGITPIGLRSFTLAPYLPAAWPDLRLQMTAFGHRLTITVSREGEGRLHVVVLAEAETVLDTTGADGTIHSVVIP
ncbi:MAG: hypothetical protein H7Z41_12750 [Cytophagales bacterium]|nr:hypothetical protein [Armatimonadota bacterium]